MKEIEKQNYSVALVIVTFNRCKLLREVLLSAVEQTVRPNVIYVIDNNSTDGTWKEVQTIIKQCENTLEIVYHNTGYNAGGAGGFAIGSKLAYDAGYEYIWLSDDDVLFEKDCLEQLLNNLDSGDILQPLRLNTDGSCAEISGINYKINNPLYLNPKRTRICDIDNDSSWKIQRLFTIPFEGPLIKREVFSRIGFPDEQFFIFYDDLDFALRAAQSGFKIVCVRNAHMVRKIRFTQTKALNSWKGYFMYRNFFHVQKKYAKKPIGLFRVLLIFILVSGYSVLTLKFNSLKPLFCALKDGLSDKFTLNERFKPK